MMKPVELQTAGLPNAVRTNREFAMGDDYDYHLAHRKTHENTELAAAGSSWTRTDLEYLRDYWRKIPLVQLAADLNRTEEAMAQRWQQERARPEAERFTPRERSPRRAYGHRLERDVPDPDDGTKRRSDYGKGNDEARWWEKGYYK